jgi:type II secretory pathway pseudopilin PulG
MRNSCNHNLNKRRPREKGFTYIALLILVAIIGVGLVTTGQVWITAMKREKEQQLLFIGGQFRHAITLYYKNSLGQSARFPMSLEDLLKDPRYLETRRYLRQIYPDPINNSLEWGLVKGPNGEIYGVYSLSQEEPFKKSNFSLADHAFEGKTQYSDWVFRIAVKAGVAQPAPASQVPPSS